MAASNIEMLRSYGPRVGSFRRTGVTADYSRSRNLFYENISKMDDVTRFNTFNNRVTLYKNYPNRGKTPIKAFSERRLHSVRAFIPAKERLVKDILKNNANGANPGKTDLYQRLMKAEIRPLNAFPKIAKHQSGLPEFVMNDFHIKETNPGFARNNLGGFYTR